MTELDDMLLLDEHSQRSSQRFLERGEYRSERTKWEKNLQDENFMNDNEFLAEHRGSITPLLPYHFGNYF
jgi:hypothetical protein